MRKRDVKQDPLRGHGAPPIGEVPEHQQEPIVDAAQVADREVERQPVAALKEASRDGRRNLWPPAGPSAERAIEHRHLRGLDHLPTDLHRNRVIGADSQPWLQHVAGAEELGGRVVADRDLPREKALHDQKPQVCHVVEIVRADNPCPAWVALHVGHKLPAGGLQILVA